MNPPMMPSDADKMAATRLLGYDVGRPCHPDVRGLEGADKCAHMLVGNGRVIDPDHMMVGNGRVIDPNSQEDASWLARPYRHHTFTHNGKVNSPYCKCGNSQQNPTHLQCWSTEDGH